MHVVQRCEERIDDAVLERAFKETGVFEIKVELGSPSVRTFTSARNDIKVRERTMCRRKEDSSSVQPLLLWPELALKSPWAESLARFLSRHRPSTNSLLVLQTISHYNIEQTTA